MSRLCLAGCRLFSSLTFALLVLGALSVPDNFAFANVCADPCPNGSGGGVSSHCPNPNLNPCSGSNAPTNQTACTILGCRQNPNTCWCVWSGTACSCPP
jgi:hypothetical protein